MSIFYGTRYRRIPAMFRALSSGTARSVLYYVCHHGHLSGSDIADYIGVSQQTVSRHLAQLCRAGLVARMGWAGYVPDSAGLDELAAFITAHFDPRVGRGAWTAYAPYPPARTPARDEDQRALSATSDGFQ